MIFRRHPVCTWVLALAIALAAAAVHAIEVRFERVAEGVYAHIGNLGPRSIANEGLNANAAELMPGNASRVYLELEFE